MFSKKIKNIVKEEIENFLDEKVHADSGLGRWFKQDWVDISRKKKDGSHPECGASSNKGKRKGKGKHFKAYPKCRPKKKADNMSAKEKKNATQRKRKAVKKDKNKSTPTNTK